MTTLLRAALAAASLAALTLPATPASASIGGRCFGTYDFACTYCSYAGGLEQYPPSYCARPDLHPGYVNRPCLVWYQGACTG